MALRCGIVGLPNVGKSTIFNALTHSNKALAANYPFATIEPNIGRVPVPDKRLEELANLNKSVKVIPTFMDFIDIAGLVKGASEGEGLGNAFLSNIREMQALAHVVRCFEDQNITHVDGSIDPVRDAEIINLELIFADIETISKRILKTEKLLKTSDQEIKKNYELLMTIKSKLESGNFISLIEYSKDEQTYIRTLNLLTVKPMFYIANISEDGLKNQEDHLERLNELALAEGVEVIPICAQVESELAEMEDEESELFMEELGINSSGLDQLTNSGYRMLDQITYFTAGKQEVRAWEIRKGTTAPEAAGKIHTDFEKGFIRAEVFHFDDIDRLGSESSIKEAGKWRLEGREYVVQDGDIMHFRFNV